MNLLDIYNGLEKANNALKMWHGDMTDQNWSEYRDRVNAVVSLIWETEKDHTGTGFPLVDLGMDFLVIDAIHGVIVGYTSSNSAFVRECLAQAGRAVIESALYNRGLLN